MSRRSSLLQLPEDLRRALNSKIVSNGFADYDGLKAWLSGELLKRDLEIKVSRSAIHRHGQAFEERLEKFRIATDQARAISEGSEDDAGTMNEALLRMVQTEVFDVLSDMQDVDKKNIHKIGLTVARLARASVNQKRWVEEHREKIKSRASDAALKAAQLEGLDEESANRIGAAVASQIQIYLPDNKR